MLPSTGHRSVSPAPYRDRMLSLTFDTNVLRYLDPDHETPLFVPALTALMEMVERGSIDGAYVGLIVERDLAKAPEEKRPVWLGRIKALPLEGVAGIAVLDEWALGRDALGSSEAAAVLDSPDLLPRRIGRRDRLHLHAHRAHDRDIFVTGDKHILRHRETIATAGIVVMNPDDALRLVSGGR